MFASNQKPGVLFGAPCRMRVTAILRPVPLPFHERRRVLAWQLSAPTLHHELLAVNAAMANRCTSPES